MIGMHLRRAFEYVRYGVKRRLHLDVDLLESAASVDELHRGEIITGNPCIALPGQYERIEAGAFGIDIAKEIAELQGAPRKIGPTLRYTFDDVLISDATIYGRGRRKMFNLQAPPVPIRTTRIGSARLGGLRRGRCPQLVYRLPFLRTLAADDSATHLLASEYGTPISMPTPSWPDQAGYLAVFGQSSVAPRRARIRRLVLFEDITQNAHKAARFRRLRALVAHGRAAPATRIVYLVRGSGGEQRLLVNEPEITEALARRGVVILQAEALGVQELLSALFGARLVISVEGSQLSHALYTLREAGGVLAIQPPNRFFNSHMDWARALGMRYGVVVGERRNRIPCAGRRSSADHRPDGCGARSIVGGADVIAARDDDLPLVRHDVADGRGGPQLPQRGDHFVGQSCSPAPRHR